MTETVLFVGGSQDGKMKNVKERMRYYDIPVLMKGGFGIERYWCEILHFGTKEHPVYLSMAESPDNLIPLLIEGYRKEKK